MMMILYFQSSAHMEAAYGFSITITMMMTTLLLSYFLYYRLKWHKMLVWSVFLMFIAIEFSFFIANVVKIKERWMFLFFELFIFMVMYIWFKARKVNNSLIRFEDLGKHTALISALSLDENIPKFATHLIYLSKANSRNEIEEKIVKSIFAKKPKRADVYWFVHINRTEQPYTLSYEVNELVDDKVIKVNINIGFRVQPKTELYFKQIVKELVFNKELNLHTRPDGSTRYNAEPDFKFVLFNKFLSVENELSVGRGLLIDSYFFLRRLGQSDEKAFGLDRSDVVTEQVPLIYAPAGIETLTRKL
jgi:KUP system potassium uptake protein